MAEINPPFALQNAGATHTAAGDRMLLSGLLMGGTGLGGRGGVSPDAGSELAVTQTGTASMAVQINTGIAFVPGTQVGVQGVYCCVNDASVTVPVTAAHGTLPRVDTVIARVYDSQYSGASDFWKLEVIAGTPASSPVAPTLPANSLPIYNISVGAAVTSITNGNLSDRRIWATAIGGVISVRDQAERDSLAGFNNLNTPLVFRFDTGNLEARWNGQWWVRSPQPLIVTNQVSQPPFNVTGSYIDFTTGAWPRPTFVVPRSGSFRITIGASIRNLNSATSSIWAGWRLTGGITYQNTDTSGISAEGNSRVYASRSFVMTGQTVGASVTVIPIWYISAGNNTTAYYSGGQLQVELLP